jgi:hypothetical protein
MSAYLQTPLARALLGTLAAFGLVFGGELLGSGGAISGDPQNVPRANKMILLGLIVLFLSFATGVVFVKSFFPE